MAWITRSDAAAALGVTRQAVYAAIKTGRLTAREFSDGSIKINSETMREEWASKTQTRTGVGIKPPSSNEPRVLRSREERMAPRRLAETQESVPDYNESRARTEHLKAELLELERQQKEGLLVKAEDVEREWGVIVALVRTKVLGLPTKAKQRLPDLDVDAIQELEKLCRECLEELSNGDD